MGNMTEKQLGKWLHGDYFWEPPKPRFNLQESIIYGMINFIILAMLIACIPEILFKSIWRRK